MSSPPLRAHLEWVNGSAAFTFFFDLVEDESWENGAVITDQPVEKGADVSDNVRPQNRRCTLRVFATNEPMQANNWQTPVTLPLTLDVETPSWVPGPGIIKYDVWDNLIELRALGGTAAGLAGGAIGGATGAAIGALAGSAILSQLAGGVAVPTVVQTDAGLRPPTPTGPVTVQASQFVDAADFVAQMTQLFDSFVGTGQLFTVVGTKRTVANMVLEKVGDTRNYDTGSGSEFTLVLREIRFVETVDVPAPAPAVKTATPTVSKGAQATTDSDKSSVALAGIGTNAGAAVFGYLQQKLGLGDGP